LFWVGRVGLVVGGLSVCIFRCNRRIGIVVCQVFNLFLFVCSYLLSCARGWEVVFVDLCVVLINLWDSFSQVWPSVISIVAQGVPVIGVGVEVFVYPFRFLGRPSFFFAKSEECISSTISWVVLVDFLDSAVVLCKAKATWV